MPALGYDEGDRAEQAISQARAYLLIGRCQRQNRKDRAEIGQPAMNSVCPGTFTRVR